MYVTRKNTKHKLRILYDLAPVSYEVLEMKTNKIKYIDDEGRTSLMTACIHGETDELSKYVSELNETDDDGWTALMYASYHGHLNIVTFLVNQGADIDKTTHSGLKASQLAYFNGQYEISQWLTNATDLKKIE